MRREKLAALRPELRGSSASNVSLKENRTLCDGCAGLHNLQRDVPAGCAAALNRRLTFSVSLSVG